MFKVKIDGLESVLKKVEKYDKALGEGVINVLSEGAENIAANARARAPKGRTKRLANSIIADTSQPYRKSVSVFAPHAPFVEFGTGSRVFDSPFQFTPAMKEYAMDFFVSGKGRMPAAPFLFPAYTAEIIQIRNRLRKLFFDI